MLAMDTSTSVVCAAVHDGSQFIAGEAIAGEMAHAELLAPVISRLIAGRTLTHIAVGVGPGPFTGLRVGITTAAVMAHALEIPAFGFCSLDAIAHGRTGTVITDAKRREVYAATFRDGIRLGEPVVGQRHELNVVEPVIDEVMTAEGLADVAARTVRDGTGLALTPMYLRKPDAVAATARKSVLGS